MKNRKKHIAKKLESIAIKGNGLTFVICKNDNFWERKTLMNTKGVTFFNLDWANKSAQNYICDNCGYLHWYLKQ